MYIPLMVLRTQRYTGPVAPGLPSPRNRLAAPRFELLLKSLLIPALALAPFMFSVACGSTDTAAYKDGLGADLGNWVDANHDNFRDSIDINGDGKPDGFAVDSNSDGKPDALALDTNCDGRYDSLDTNGDGMPDLRTSRDQITVPASCHYTNPVSAGQSGSGGAPGTGGGSAMGGSGAAGSPATAGTGAVVSQLGQGTYEGMGDTTNRYAKNDVYRDGVGYMFIANGWGANWQNHSISWSGTSFTVKSFSGSEKLPDHSPAGYPSLFCGLYSNEASDKCGLPATIASVKSIKTGWRWKANGNTGQYNAAWDIWLGDGGNLTSYLMVWLRDPPGQQPAGTNTSAGETIKGLPGSNWKIVKGTVTLNNVTRPIVNYVQPEGSDLGELEFDVLDLYKDAISRGYNLPGSQILAVATGFEIWNGPITNLATEDFYVDVK